MKGSSLSGAVTFEVEGALEHQPDACHCSQYRKQTSYVYVGVNVRRHALTVHRADKITWCRSSEKVQRGFCSVCGSALSWDLNIDGYDFTGVSMGAFEPPSGARLAKHIFVGE